LRNLIRPNVKLARLVRWFYLLVFTKTAFISSAFAAVLHASGLIGDPFVWVQTLPFLMPRQHA
jgi:hypothetical protein